MAPGEKYPAKSGKAPRAIFLLKCDKPAAAGMLRVILPRPALALPAAAENNSAAKSAGG